MNILDRKRILDILRHLRADETPLFGMMTPQHMVEHLAGAVCFSNGKAPQQLHNPPEKAEKIKSVMIYTDREFPTGFKAPVLATDTLPSLRHPNLPVAIENVIVELADFERYFEQYPSAKPVNPVMGELTRQEWLVFHGKHFTHHFKQFRLIQ